MKRRVRIGTRGSALALAQANWLKQALEQRDCENPCELVVIRTSGDRFVDRSLRALGGKGLFVKEIEDALLRGDIDVAIHSMKDLPAEIPPGLVISAVPEREDPRDVLVSSRPGGLGGLPHGARVGTCSLRRMALLRASRADLEIEELRGNVDTRLRRLGEGHVGAIVLASAGLNRLGLAPANLTFMDPDSFVPAIGQGALAVESRAGDELTALLAGLDHAPTRTAVTAERAFLGRVGGSCRTPIAAHAVLHDARLSLAAVIAAPDGTQVIRDSDSGEPESAEAMGLAMADRLLAAGGAEIIAKLAET